MTILLCVIGIIVYLIVGRVVITLLKENGKFDSTIDGIFPFIPVLIFPSILFWKLIVYCSDWLSFEIDWYLTQRRIRNKQNKKEKL